MIFRRVLRSKIHRASVTQADLDYEGSITISPVLLTAAGIGEYEAVQVWNVTRGTRFETYTMIGAANSNDICVNGAAAHLAEPGDLIIIACFMYVEDHKMASYKPRIIFVDRQNQIVEQRDEDPGPGKKRKLRVINV